MKWGLLVLIVLFSCSCKGQKHESATVNTDNAKMEVSVNYAKDSISIDTTSYDDTIIQNHQYELVAYLWLAINRDSSVVDSSNSYFVVKRDGKTILVDSSYYKNNSELFFKDANGDGFPDIVWVKKWDEHAYLFNPKIQNFVEVGECYDIDTLRVNNKIVYYQSKYPLLYFVSYDKSLGASTETHSELFVINDDYQKISFATLANWDTYGTFNKKNMTFEIRREASDSKAKEIFKCYVPPYWGVFSNISMWNMGKIVDSFTISVKEARNGNSETNDEDNGDNPVPNPFITQYWQQHYQSLLQYGQIFHVQKIDEGHWPPAPYWDFSWQPWIAIDFN